MQKNELTKLKFVFICMKILIKNILIHTVCISIGFIIFVLMMNYLSKPSNFPLHFSPSEAFDAYYFSFVYSLGTVGFIIGTIILLTALFIILLFSNWINTRLNK